MCSADLRALGVCPCATGEDCFREDLAVTTYWNLTGWDGIAFWARRGPDGQAGLTVSLLDAYSSDVLAGPFPGGTYCKVLPASCGCPAGTECLPTTTIAGGTTSAEELRCRAADAELPLEGPMVPPLCGADACAAATPGGECEPYQFANGAVGQYCLPPESPPLPEPNQRCGNPWSASIRVTTEWELYTVPFTELRQPPTGLKSETFDVSAIATLSFQFKAGWLDLYMDNLAFYRIAR
jgi:hypothetical protein